MAWHWVSTKPLSKPVLILLTYAKLKKKELNKWNTFNTYFAMYVEFCVLTR